jgi:hypothetical protein
MIRLVSILLLLFIPFGIFAQKPDSVKAPRILREWKLSPDYSEEISIPIDTVFSLFNRSRITDRYSPVNASLGNYGLPFYQMNFFDRVTDPDEFLYSTFYPFMYVPDKALFMNTQTPFTELVWTYAGPRETAEQTLIVRHSQNVNRYLNFGLIYNIVYGLGQYAYQRSYDRNFILHSSYTGNKYKLYFAAGINRITSLENGGITDLNLLDQANTRDVPVNLGGLNKATSDLKNRNLLIVQRYTLGGKSDIKSDSVAQKQPRSSGLSGTFSHIFSIENNKRSYSDNYPQSGFYDTAFINKTVTFDSLYSRSIKNTLRFDFVTDETRKVRLGVGVGIRNELFRFSQIVPTHDTTTISDTALWKRSSNLLVGRLYNNIGDKFSWRATGELFITGYRAGDFSLNGEISTSFDLNKGRASWLITGDVINRQPSFWYDHWGSNHFEWNNNLSKEFRIDLGTAIYYPVRKTEIKFNYAIINNYTDFDSTAHPSQYTGGLSVVALSFRNEMKAWKFHLVSDVIVQKSSNTDVLDLPLVTIRATGFFEHLFRFKSTNGKMNTQLGVDVNYNTLYYPYAYMPATGRFYRQDQVAAGNYPFVNAFFNFKVQRTRVFVMVDHLNSGFMGYRYSMIPYYPMNVRMFRYGVAWTFYN